MNRTVAVLLAGLCLAITSIRAHAASTNLWVQNINYALTAHVQSGTEVLAGSLSTKHILAFLSGVTNPVNQIGTATNVTTGSTTVNPTNSLFLNATNDIGLLNTYTISNYFLTANSVKFTNGFQFTNDLVVTETNNNPLTFTLTNVVAVSSNQIALVFPAVLSSSVSAVLTTNSSSNFIFTVSGVTTNTSPVFQVYPDFTKQKAARLVMVTPIVSDIPFTFTNVITTNNITTTNLIDTTISTNLASTLEVRYLAGKTPVSVDVTDAFNDSSSSDSQQIVVALPTLGFNVPRYSVTTFALDTRFPGRDFFGNVVFRQPGNALYVSGFDLQNRGFVFRGRQIIGRAVLKQRRLVGGADGFLLGQIQSKTFDNASVVCSGSITFNGGHLEKPR